MSRPTQSVCLQVRIDLTGEEMENPLPLSHFPTPPIGFIEGMPFSTASYWSLSLRDLPYLFLQDRDIRNHIKVC